MKCRTLFSMVLPVSLICLADITGRTSPRQERPEQIRPQNATIENNTVELDLTYDFSLPGDTSRIRFVVAIPGTIPDRQKILDIKYSPEPLKVFRENENRYAEFVFIRPEKHFKVQINIKAELFRYDLSTTRKKQQKRLSKGPGFKDALLHQQYIEKDAPEIQQIAKAITGRAETVIVKNIYDYVVDNMEYNGDVEKNLGALKALQQKKGDCTEYSSLFVALCRAKNIPARAVYGYTSEFKDTPRHSWAEVYLKNYGWVPFDPTAGDVENTWARTQLYYTMKPIYIYLGQFPKDEALNDRLYAAYWRWGDEIKLEDSIEVRQLPKPTRQAP